MALPEYPINREETFLASAAGQEVDLPDYPITREEKYLAKIAGEDVEIPEYPITRVEKYLDYIAEHGGGASGTPIEVSTAAEMDAALVAENLGKAYKYIGTSDILYTNGDIYVVIVYGSTLRFKRYADSSIASTPLCFTAEQPNSTVSMSKNGSPPAISLETSRDGVTWTAFTVGSSVITLDNVGDKVYFRGDNTALANSGNNYHYFSMAGKVKASGMVMSLLDKTMMQTAIPTYAFGNLFFNCTALTEPPELTALEATGADCYASMFKGCTSLTEIGSFKDVNLKSYSFGSMFYGCTSLAKLPKLPAKTLVNNSYNSMFYGCTNIKISESQEGEYQTEYRIPTSGEATESTATNSMFSNTGGTFTGTPSLNTTYYTANEVV